MTQLASDLIKMVCCNCGVVMREGVEPDGLVSHGICPECRRLLYPEYAEPVVHEEVRRWPKSAGQ